MSIPTDPIGLVEHVIDVMHKPPKCKRPSDMAANLIADIRAEYEAGAKGYYLPRPTMKWLLDALTDETVTGEKR